MVERRTLQAWSPVLDLSVLVTQRTVHVLVCQSSVFARHRDAGHRVLVIFQILTHGADLGILPARWAHGLHVDAAEVLQIDAVPASCATALLDQVVVRGVQAAVTILATEFVTEAVAISPV